MTLCAKVLAGRVVQVQAGLEQENRRVVVCAVQNCHNLPMFFLAWSHCEIVTLCNTAAGKMINDLVVHRAEDYRRVVEESDIMFKVTCDV
jgi:hypothetical protein